MTRSKESSNTRNKEHFFTESPSPPRLILEAISNTVDNPLKFKWGISCKLV